jgi:hypothetical protein
MWKHPMSSRHLMGCCCFGGSMSELLTEIVIRCLISPKQAMAYANLIINTYYKVALRRIR